MKRRVLPLLPLACWALASAACDRHREEAFLPTAPGTAEALTVSPASTSVPADGFSRVVITGRITSTATTNRRQVRFQTTGGTFIDPDAADTTGRTKTGAVDTQGVVNVELRSDTTVRLVTVTATVIDSSTNEAVPGLVKRTDIQFTPPEPQDVIRVSTSASSGEADDFTQVFVHADVAPGLPAGDRTVEFQTSLGTFVKNGEMTVTEDADGSHRATVALKSPAMVGEARITAKVSNTTAETFLRFNPAPPDTVRVVLGATRLVRPGMEMTTVTVTLARDPGRGSVSQNTEVEYSAYEKDYGDSLPLLFRNRIPSNAAGVATADLLLGSVEFVGTATVRARVGSVQGEEDIDVDAPPTGAPEIGVAPASLDFGQVATGASSDMTVTVSNSGTAALSVNLRVVMGGEFSLINPPAMPAEVAAGGAPLTLTVRFSPTSTGAKTDTLEITSNDQDEATVSVALTGEGT